MFNFDIFKGLFILTELGKLAKFGRKIRQNRQIYLICQLSLSFKKTQLTLMLTYVDADALWK